MPRRKAKPGGKKATPRRSAPSTRGGNGRGKTKITADENSAPAEAAETHSNQTSADEAAANDQEMEDVSGERPNDGDEAHEVLKTADPWDPSYVRRMARNYPDQDWLHHAAPRGQHCQMLSELEANHFPRKYARGISTGGIVYGLELSPDGTILAVFGSRPYISLFMSSKPFDHIIDLFDDEESHIDSFYTGTFTPDGLCFAAGLKRKDRQKWNDEEDDNEILPCPVKIFDIGTGKASAHLVGHEEEIMSIRGVSFKNNYYFLTTSQDGGILKWKMLADYKTLAERTKMEDSVTCMAFDTSFLPGTGNKYFLAACDFIIMLFDFETAKCLQTFDSPYSLFLVNIKFVHCVDLADGAIADGAGRSGSQTPEFAYFLTRGIESAQEDGCTPIRQSFCALHRLRYPKRKKGEFVCEEVKRFQHGSFLSNYYPVRDSTNGRYLLAPHQDGSLTCFDLLSGKPAWIIKMQDGPLRRVLFHPKAKLAYAAGDDGTVHVWGQDVPEGDSKPWQAVKDESV